ncbi:hypothetical protein GQ600_19989 [Phytophthora cactorum]|nr:hypothetical protein GQ600_19989 [Phytophthora cactorum]
MQTDYSALLGVAPDRRANCGVLIIKWFETYLNVASNTKLDEDLKDLTPQLISDKVDECRYQMFQSVFVTLQQASVHNE